VAVTAKPKTVDQFIAAGSAVASEPIVGNDEAIQPVSLRLPTAILREIDNVVKARRPSPSRHQWILEAIYDKLDREQRT
jgi:hypothetical protein